MRETHRQTRVQTERWKEMKGSKKEFKRESPVRMVYKETLSKGGPVKERERQ